MPIHDHEQIAILDFGSQYTHLISRRLRELHVLAKIYRQDIPVKTLSSQNCIGIILSGGPMSVHDQTALSYDPDIFALNLPVLGICYGHQLIAQHFNGAVQPGNVKEYGFAQLKLNKQTNKTIFKNLPDTITVWMSHGDSVTALPEGFKQIGKTEDCHIAAMENDEKRIYGLQFHPEVHHTKDNDHILKNFAYKICSAAGDWKIHNLLDEIESDIREQAKKKKIFMLVSGGVDSTVAFAMLKKTLDKKNVIGLHINSGLMRKNESSQVHEALARAGFNNLTVVDAENEFLDRLAGVSDPEKKRHIIGNAYLDVAEKWFETHAEKEEFLLGQGTIYPDTIESGGTKNAETIKTHHNRVPRIQEMIKQGKVIEPLKNFYKDEVRKIGKELGIAKELLFRHPFPGPGLGIMTLCSQDNLSIPDISLPPESCILPIQSTGVQGDQRTYAFVLATWQETPLTELREFATHTANRIREINRVVKILFERYPKKNHAYCHQKNMYVTKDRLDLLRAIHDDITDSIQKAHLYDDIWEFPIILLPVGLSKKGQSIVLRPAASREVMTVDAYELPEQTIKNIVEAIKQYTEIDAVFYDVTSKPPATMQWE